MSDESKTYRIKSDLVKKAKKKHFEFIIDTKNTEVVEAEVINAMIFKGQEDFKNSDLIKYLELVKDKKIK